MVAFVGGFAIFVAMALLGVPQNAPIPRAIGAGIVLAMLATIVYSLWVHLAIRIYRCPQCGGKTERVDHPHQVIHKYCAPCNVEWITGLRESASAYD